MAIYTKISLKHIRLIEKNYNLGKIIHFKGIKKGIENTNYLLKTKNKKFILTLFEKRVHKKDLPFFMNLMDKLSKYKVNCPKPQKNKKGGFLIKIKNKIGNKSKIINPNLNTLMKTAFSQIKNKWPKSLPYGIIHADLFIDNIFFKKSKFHGYIDFYFACNDFLMYEIAICINALCFDKKNNKFIFNKRKSTNLIRGYSKIRKLSNKEKKSLNVLCRGAALRYLLTRTYDYLNTPKSAVIKIKNPREYIQKLKVHNKFKNFKNYYN